MVNLSALAIVIAIFASSVHEQDVSVSEKKKKRKKYAVQIEGTLTVSWVCHI